MLSQRMGEVLQFTKGRIGSGRKMTCLLHDIAKVSLHRVAALDIPSVFNKGVSIRFRIWSANKHTSLLP